MASASKSALIPPSQRVEAYVDIEARIQAALTFISTTQDDYPNLASLAKSYEIPLERLRARWQGRQSKLDRPGANRKLSEDQEAAVCQYLDRLDMLGTSARLQMVSSCANAILQKSYIGSGTAPIVSEQWARRFLARHQNTIFENSVLSMSTVRTPTSLTISALGLRSISLFASNTGSRLQIHITLMKPDFALVLEEISG